MGQDAKNSIVLWAAALISTALFWAALRFDLVPPIPDEWLWPTVWIIAAVNLAHAVWRSLRQRQR